VIKAIDLMVKNDIGSVVVGESGKPVDILTERDIMRKVCPQELFQEGHRWRGHGSSYCHH
jgi:CBS domain-containing protein